MQATQGADSALALAEAAPVRCIAQPLALCADAPPELPLQLVPTAAEAPRTGLPKEIEGLSNQEAVRRLRLLGQPATLFGEGERDRLLRLHVVQRNISPRDQAHLGGGQQANELQRQMRGMAADAARQLDKARCAAAARPSGEPTEEEATAAAFKAAAASLAAQRAEVTMEHPERIVAHFKKLIEEWEAEVLAKAEAAPAWASSLEGRSAISTMRLTKEHIRPLFRLLKRRECPGDIERALWCIVKAMRLRNYKEAGDLYVRVAIGNSPWPIGVTMVGIHERSAREKISAQSTAHVMHDEQTRKYLQAVKRLITFAQRRYPSTPSLSMEFNSGANGSDKLVCARARVCVYRCSSASQALLEASAGAGGAGNAPLLLLEGALPSSYTVAANGKAQDGWRHNDQDIRTWKSIQRVRGAPLCALCWLLTRMVGSSAGV